MFRLTREVRFALNGAPDPQLEAGPSNSYGGYPSPVGFGPYLTMTATVRGDDLLETGYLLNIKQIDAAVRGRCVERLGGLAGKVSPAMAVGICFREVGEALKGVELEALELGVSPFLSYKVFGKEQAVVRLTQKFEFSASHRLHSPGLTEAENVAAYGKCNNPHGHGHNYELAVEVEGVPDTKTGVLVDLVELELAVGREVIARFDHRHLNVEVEEFKTLVPTVENIAKVIYGLLKGKLGPVKLSSVTVWETPKTWCHYSED